MAVEQQAPEEQQTGRRGYILLLVGDERRCSEAALGIALRGAGHNMRIHISQLLNRNDRLRGEVSAVSFLTGVTLSQHGTRGATQAQSETDGPGITPDRLETALREATNHVERRVTNILIMDGVLTLIDQGVLDESRIIDLLNRAGEGLDIILTGRSASDQLIESADIVTEMKSVKSPDEAADMPRRGLDY